jgi:transposase
MKGRFTGLTDEQWQVLEPFLPTKRRRVGRPNPDLRKVLNTIFYVQITGCRWCDVPIGEIWAKRSTAHEWLGLLEELGIWEKIRNSILAIADLAKQISWDKGAVDGSFSPWKGRRAGR